MQNNNTTPATQASDAMATRRTTARGRVVATTAMDPSTGSEKFLARVERDCLCGCGRKTWSWFAQGHDARLAGQVGRGERPASLLVGFPKLEAKAAAVAALAASKAEAKANRPAGRSGESAAARAELAAARAELAAERALERALDARAKAAEARVALSA